MSEISDELREWCDRNDENGCGGFVTEYSFEDICDLADRIDAEMVELPKDADGEYIRVGDTLDGYGKTIEVVEMRYGRGGWVLISRDGSGYADTFAFAHHHEPTVEDVLREFAYGLGVPVADSYVAATAAKLRHDLEEANNQAEEVCIENAKLRELVADMYKAFMHGNCYRWCEFKEPCNYITDGKCQWYDRMRELGVEV